MRSSSTYNLLTFYIFRDITNPQAEIKSMSVFCGDIGMKGRIYIGEEGISATVTCNAGQKQAYMMYLAAHPVWSQIQDIEAKASIVEGHMFDKMIVKYRAEIVALGQTITQAAFARSCQEIDDTQLKEILDTNDPERVVLDMRNSYEHKLGHFKGAIPAGTINFREVESMIETYKTKFAHKKVLMYCTGGIRCDKLSVLLKEKGVDNFYALAGGVVKYVNAHNDGNWLGNLYTFDGVVSKQIGDDETHTTIGKCIYTGLSTNHCENCRYSPCNARIIARRRQFKRWGGFCSSECYENALADGRIKNDSFDTLDYNQLRQDVRSGTISQDAFIAVVQAHLPTLITTAPFPHATSQKEELVDKEYLEKYLM